MIKKALLFLLTLLPLAASAQQAVGSWYFYPLYDGVPTRVVDTPELTYYLSLGRLYSYDKHNDESRDYVELLNDTGISKIDYNADGKFLFIGYENGNVDLLYDDGHVVNMPDIREAQISYDKSINEVDFLGNQVYVATKFGLVVFDAGTGTVRQSGIYGKNVTAVALQGDYVIINVEKKNYGIKRTELISRFENFQQLDDIANVVEMKGMGDYILIRTNTLVRAAKYDFPDGKMNVMGTQTQAAASPLMRCADGKMRTVSGNIVYAYGKDGERTQESSIPASLKSNAYGMWRGCSDVWAANADGLGCYDITGSSLTVKTDRMLPENAINMAAVGLIKASPDGSRIYLSTLSESYVSVAKSPRANGSKICILTDEGIKDVSPAEGLTLENSNKTDKITLQTNLAVNPFDPEMILVPTQTQGLYLIKNGKQVHQFTSKNSKMESIYNATRCYGAAVDPNGNLWATSLMINGGNKAINILPSDKFKGNLSNITADDWVNPTVNGFDAHSDVKFVFVPNTNIVYVIMALHGPILVYDTNGTISNLADDKHRLITSAIDQDGKTFNSDVEMEMVIDKKGAIWIGTNNGLFSIDNPADGLNPEMRITRMKIPRNDGTNFADYLLDGEEITAIAVDGSNNKWIGTKASGLYYVNADGSAILSHFTSSNSPLPDNVIASLYCDTNSNEIYIGTNFGLLRYSGFHSPGREDYSEVYAYPNPVKPDYSGWITVTGMMDNSLVKIADASGNVVYQGRSDGGMFTWDGCNSAGARVKSGVYYVFASQSENGSSSAAVTKILIMN